MYCRKLNLATKKDWRLPDYNELLSLVNYFRFEPAKIDELTNVVPDKYWTSSTDITDISANWYVDFNYGETGVTLKYTKLHVRCVRELSDKEGDF